MILRCSFNSSSHPEQCMSSLPGANTTDHALAACQRWTQSTKKTGNMDINMQWYLKFLRIQALDYEWSHIIIPAPLRIGNLYINMQRYFKFLKIQALDYPFGLIWMCGLIWVISYHYPCTTKRTGNMYINMQRYFKFFKNKSFGLSILTILDMWTHMSDLISLSLHH